MNAYYITYNGSWLGGRAVVLAESEEEADSGFDNDYSDVDEEVKAAPAAEDAPVEEAPVVEEEAVEEVAAEVTEEAPVTEEATEDAPAVEAEDAEDDKK